MSYNIPNDVATDEVVFAEDINNIKNSIDALKGGIAGDAPSKTVEDLVTLNTLYSDHGNLSGLTDDDHTQYMPTIGGRTFSNKILYDTNKTFSDDKELVAKKYVDDTTSNVVKQLKNYILNGDMKVAQEWTSKATIATTDYIIDNFRFNKTTSGVVFTASQETDSSGTYNIKLDCTTADASVDANDDVSINFFVEGYEYATLKGETCVLSFDIYATKTGTSCVSFRNNGLDRTYILEFTINASNTWETKTLEVAFDQTGGTENYTNGSGLRCDFALLVGSTRQNTANTWHTGSYVSTSNQINHGDNTANEFKLRNVSLTIGNAANFDRDLIIKENFLETLQKCQRYYEKSYNYNTTPGTATQLGGQTFKIGVNSTTNGDACRGLTIFKVIKRTTPNMTTYDFAGTLSQVSINGSASNEAPAAGNITTLETDRGFESNFNTTTAGIKVGFHWEADSRF